MNYIFVQKRTLFEGGGAVLNFEPIRAFVF
jgi:hypothetical protein